MRLGPDSLPSPHQVLVSSSPPQSEASYQLVGCDKKIPAGLQTRSAELATLKDLVHSRPMGVTLLTGPEGSGKFTLLQALVGDLKDDQSVLPVYLDLVSTNSRGQPKFADEAFADALRGAVRKYLAANPPALLALNKECDVDLGSKPMLDRVMFPFYHHRCSWPANGCKLGKGHLPRLVVMVDDVDKMQDWPEEREECHRILQGLVEGIDEAHSAHVILSTSSSSVESWLHDAIGNRFQVASLGHLTEPQAKEFFVEQCLPEARSKLTRAYDWTKVYDVCGGSPRLLRTCAANTYLGSWEAALESIASAAAHEVQRNLMKGPKGTGIPVPEWTTHAYYFAAQYICNSGGAAPMDKRFDESVFAMAQHGKLHLRRAPDLRGPGKADVEMPDGFHNMVMFANPAQLYAARLSTWLSTSREVDLGKWSKESLAKRARLEQQNMAASAATAQAQVSGVLGEVGRAVQQVGGSISRVVQGDGQTYTVSVRPPAHHEAPPRSIMAAQSGLGWLAVLAALAGVAYLLGKKLLGWRFGGARAGQGGRWISDRSLGGKMVFVPDEPEAAPRARAPRQDSTDLSAARSQAASAVASTTAPESWARSAHPAASSSSSSSRPNEAARAVPSWWDPPPVVSLGKAFKEQALKQAMIILQEMEDAKLLSGRDYPTSSLVALRQTCGDSGVAVRAQTDSGRDALFRAGCEAAASCAAEQSTGLLAGTSPQRFLSGLAQDLGIPEAKAATMAQAVVAAKARGTLVDACAAYRDMDAQEVLYQLLRLAGLLDRFPFARSSPEADMIATAMQQRGTLEERQAIFLTYGGMEPRTAALVAEMLGFDPDLVMPHAAAHAARQREALGMPEPPPAAQQPPPPQESTPSKGFVDAQ
ncbi:hypothetical protein WJX72_003223 [[Myrmecia] bisecta]|uniref:ATPase domain-containing protein n=1 Tax=[Myrmecia] bisecta TaxID=41462 RepID=A0AAW1P1N9_9CHLO